MQLQHVKMWVLRDATTIWESQVEEFKMSASYGESLEIDGEALEFEWLMFQGFSSLQVLQKIQNGVQGRNVEPEKYGERIIFLSMFNDIEWTRKRNEENCISNSDKVKTCPNKFSQWCNQSAFLKESGIPQFHRRYSDSRKQVTLSLQVQCIELWNSENAERKRNHTLQCGGFKHRTLVPKHSFCESAQYLRNSFELV